MKRRKSDEPHRYLARALLALFFLVLAGSSVLTNGVVGARKERQGSTSWRATLIPVRRLVLATSRSGVIKEYHLEEGEACTEGQVILELFDEESRLELGESEGVLAAAQARRERAQGELESLEILYAGEHATARELKLARSDLEVARARCQEARSRVAKARLNLAMCKLRAPFAGRLQTCRRKPGEALGAYTAVCDLVDTRSLHAVIQVTPAELASLRLRQELFFRHREGRIFTGELAGVGVQLNPGSRKLRVRIRVPNPEGVLWAGDGGTVILEKE